MLSNVGNFNYSQRFGIIYGLNQFFQGFFLVESHHLVLVVAGNRIFRDYKLTRKNVAI